MAEITQQRHLSKNGWLIGFLLFPIGPFICLRMVRAISSIECILGCLSGIVVHGGMVGVLQVTNKEPLQVFLVLLLGVSQFLLGFWMFWGGQRAGIWTPTALKQWRLAGRFFGGFLGLGLAANIAVFLLQNLLRN